MERASNKKVTIFAIILSLAAIGVLVFGFMVVSSSKVVLLQSVSNLYAKITDLPEDTSILLDKLSQSNDIGVKGIINIKQGKKEYALTYDYLENKKDLKSSLSVNGKQNEQEIFNGNVFSIKNNLYLFIKDVTPNYYKLNNKYTSILKSISNDDYEEVINLLKDAIDSSIENDSINKEKTTIEYQGKEKKVTKLTYSVTNKLVENIASKFVKSLKSNKQLINNMSKSLDISNKELIKYLDECVKALNQSDNKEIFKYQIYYYGFNKIIKYEIYDSIHEVLIEYKVDTNESLNIKVKDINYLYLEFTKKKKTYTFKGKLLDVYDFSGIFSDNLLELVFKLDKEYKLNVVYSIDSNDKKYKQMYQITLSEIKNEKTKQLILIDMVLEYYFGEKIDNNINITDSNTFDYEQIVESLEDSFGISIEDLYKKINIIK